MVGKECYRKKDCKVYCSCDKKQHIFGTGFIIRKHSRSRVIDFKPIDRRMCMFRMIGIFQNCRSIYAHAVTEEEVKRKRISFMSD